MKHKKGATPPAILMLAMLVIVLVGASLYFFITGDNKIDKKISDARIIEEAYIKEEQIRLFLSGFLGSLEDKSRENIIKEAEKINSKEMKEIAEKLKRGEFAIEERERKRILKISPEIRIEKEIVVVYQPVIEVEI